MSSLLSGPSSQAESIRRAVEVVAAVGVPANSHDVVHPGDRQVQHRAMLVVAFETDVVSDFLDLVQQLRETEASRYTLRDTPMFTCVAQPLPDILEAIGA